MTTAKRRQQPAVDGSRRDHRKTADIEYAPAKPGTWQDGVEATSVALYAAIFGKGEWPAANEDYPNLNKLVEALREGYQ